MSNLSPAPGDPQGDEKAQVSGAINALFAVGIAYAVNGEIPTQAEITTHVMVLVSGAVAYAVSRFLTWLVPNSPK